MSALDAIAGILETLAASEDVPMGSVYYGMCPEEHLDTWNYFVFNRTQTAPASNGRDWQTEYAVHIIHEDYIPEGYVGIVRKAFMDSADLVIRATPSAVKYDYLQKGSTGIVVEIATLYFFVPEKR